MQGRVSVTHGKPLRRHRSSPFGPRIPKPWEYAYLRDNTISRPTRLCISRPCGIDFHLPRANLPTHGSQRESFSCVPENPSSPMEPAALEIDRSTRTSAVEIFFLSTAYALRIGSLDGPCRCAQLSTPCGAAISDRFSCHDVSLLGAFTAYVIGVHGSRRRCFATTSDEAYGPTTKGKPTVSARSK
ncbi:hypothetical protein BDV59DRAFT_173277 [Aspergillus ambiguus]|uniref:uncharacterized protein n=1 Tax=Aspergillus ambiguus TaxID=176160 RepID=UPI003CCC9756